MSKDQSAKKLIERTMKYFMALPAYDVCSKGRFSIIKDVNPANVPLTIVSFRQAIFERIKPISVLFDFPISTFALNEVGVGTWMSTQLQEISQMHEPVRTARGNVLIGGLGLGVIAHLIAAKKPVKRITVVEIEKDLIDLVKPFLNSRIEIVHADLFDYLKNVKSGQFDYAYFDIWQSTGEWTWQTLVVPLRRLACPKIDKVHCWQEGEMTGQVNDFLSRAVDMPTETLAGYAATQHYWTYRKAVEPFHPVARLSSSDHTTAEGFQRILDIQQENCQDRQLKLMANIFLNKVGTHLWEELFGQYWDQTVHLFEKEKTDKESS